MPHVSRGLIALLAATVVVAALYMVALKPGTSSSGGSGSQGQYQSAIKAAHGAVQTSKADNARAGADPTPTPASTSPTAHPAPAAHPRTTAPVASKHKPLTKPTPVRIPTSRAGNRSLSAAGRLAAVQRALRTHKVVALLFYNPAAPDDRAVDQELKGVPTHGGKVFKLAIPLNEIVNYMAITNEVPVNFSPTLVLVAPDRHVDEIVGYADQFEISQRVEQALALK